MEAQTLVPWGQFYTVTQCLVCHEDLVCLERRDRLVVNFLEKAVQLAVAVHDGSKIPTHAKQRLQMLESLM